LYDPKSTKLLITIKIWSIRSWLTSNLSKEFHQNLLRVFWVKTDRPKT